jgi:hypothetical protein
MSSIPTSAFINSASIVLQVTDISNIAYPLYDVARAWTESGATWTSDGTVNWQTAGASAITGNIDRGDTNLWSSSTTSFNTLGARTVTLNANGLAVVRRWVAGVNNSGVIIQQYTGSDAALWFDSAEGSTPPRLSINVCTPNPTAVSLVDFSTASMPQGIQLGWQTAQETELVGFNLYRAESPDGQRSQINQQLIPAFNPGELRGNAYHYLDATAEAGKMYYYWVEWVGNSGSEFYGPVTARFALYKVWLPLGLNK